MIMPFFPKVKTNLYENEDYRPPDRSIACLTASRIQHCYVDGVHY